MSKSPIDYFSDPWCETCEYWFFLRQDVIEQIEIYYPNIYKHICDGMEGKIIKGFEENGVVVDTYNDHRFYGFCKRYPPVIGDEDSVIKKIGLFSSSNTKIRKILDGYRFPVLPNNEWCGEWKLSQWGKERLKKEQNNNQDERGKN